MEQRSQTKFLPWPGFELWTSRLKDGWGQEGKVGVIKERLGFMKARSWGVKKVWVLTGETRR